MNSGKSEERDVKEKTTKPKTKAKKAIVPDDDGTERGSVVEEDEISILEHINALRKDLPIPEAIGDDQLKSWLSEEGLSSREGNSRAYLVGWTLAARRKGISHGHQTAWLESQEAVFGLGIRSMQLRMQVAVGLDSLPKSATALRISILDAPLRDIPMALKVATGEAPPASTKPPDNAKTLWKKWNKKLSAMVEEAQDDAVLRAVALPALESAVKSLTREAGTHHSTVNPHPERSVTLRKKDLTAALSRLHVVESGGGVLLVQVTGKSEDGEVEIITGSSDTRVAVVIPAMIGDDAPDTFRLSRTFLENACKAVVSPSGTLEVMEDQNQIFVYFGHGKTPLGEGGKLKPPKWPILPRKSKNEEAWSAQDLATLLLVVQGLRRTIDRLWERGAPAAVVYCSELAANPGSGDDLLAVGRVGEEARVKLTHTMASLLLKIIPGQASATVHKTPNLLTIRSTDRYGAVRTIEENRQISLHPFPQSTGNWIVLPVGPLRTAVKGLHRGPRLPFWVNEITVDTSGMAILKRQDEGSKKLATWSLAIVSRGEAVDTSGKWSLVCWQPLLEAVLAVWPHYLIQFEERLFNKRKLVVLSTPEGASPALKVLMTNPAEGGVPFPAE